MIFETVKSLIHGEFFQLEDKEDSELFRSYFEICSCCLYLIFSLIFVVLFPYLDFVTCAGKYCRLHMQMLYRL
jgi:hypothetical protein